VLNNNFEDNISLMVGVGEFTRSIETSVVASKTTEFSLFLNESTTGALGFTLMVLNFFKYF
jgi:hypothetical protein